MNDDAARSAPARGPRPTRRAVVRAGVWSAPIIAVGAAAPAFALSPCLPIPYQTGWTVANTGNLAGGTGTNAFVSNYGSSGLPMYLSVADNNSQGLETTAANNSTVTLSYTLNGLVVGRVYNFAYTLASQFAANNSATSQLQKLDIQLGSVSQKQYTTRASTALANGYTTLNTSQVNAPITQADQFNWTATATSVVYRYLWTSPARGYNPAPITNIPQNTYTGVADIAVTAPTITGC